ncbi:hypothetical protein WA588_006102, partial [Blastocystis sp. NMH]
MNNLLEKEREGEEDVEPLIRSDMMFSSSVQYFGNNTATITIQTEKDAIQVLITCESETTLEDVGKQVWSGSVLMCEYALRHKDTFHARNVLEVGSGTGLFARVVSPLCQHVIATDYTDSILSVLRRNTAMCSNVEIRQLNLLDTCAFDVVSDSEPIDLVVAADMIYDEVLTESLCRYLSSVLSHHRCFALVSGEHRLNIVDASDSLIDYEFDRFQEFVCFNEDCWNQFHVKSTGSLSFKHRCSCGKRLVGQMIPLGASAKDMYLCRLSPIC